MNDSASEKRQILLVSSDSFIEGLVRGYCLAHGIDLVFRRFVSDLITESITYAPRLLIVDGRKTGASSERDAAACAETIRVLRERSHAPLCIISDSAETLPKQYLHEHDYVVGEPLAEQLDQCLRNYTTQASLAYAERRRQARRERQDRREWQDRRTGNRPALRRPGIATCLSLPRQQQPTNGYRVGPFFIDPDSRQVAMHDRGLCLSTKEFQLFHLLASNLGKVLTADAIIIALWPESGRANKSDLYQYIHLLRRKIEADSQYPRWLVTVKGVGYRLCARPAESGLLHFSGQ